MADIKLTNVWKKYPHRYSNEEEKYVIAVSDFNLEVKSGEVIVFVGPSGCGKTTTLRMIAGLEKVSEGELYIDGKLSNDVLPSDRHISMVFQNYAMYPHMTIYENLAFGLLPCDLSEDKIKEKVEEVSRILDITHLLERKPRQLSGGQKQRVALGRALINDNEIILLDEVLSNLDVKLRSCMRTELIKIHRMFKKTFIYVTHDQAEAMALADRIVVMKDGIIKQVGTPDEIYSNPQSLYVAAFIGTPQMNLINATLTECDGDVFLVWDSNKIKLPCLNEAAREYIGKEIIAGIRSEHIYVDKDSLAKYKDSVIDADVTTAEFYGMVTHVHFSSGNYCDFIATIPSEYKSQLTDKIKVAFNPDKIYIFDKDTENVIDYK